VLTNEEIMLAKKKRIYVFCGKKKEEIEIII